MRISFILFFSYDFCATFFCNLDCFILTIIINYNYTVNKFFFQKIFYNFLYRKFFIICRNCHANFWNFNMIIL